MNRGSGPGPPFGTQSERIFLRQLPVDLQRLLAHAGRAEETARPLGRRAAHACGKSRIIEEVCELGGHGGVVTDFHQEAADLVLDHLRSATRPGGDDRAAGELCFQKGVRQALNVRGEHRGAGYPNEVRHLAAHAQEANMPRQAEAGGQLLHRPPFFSVADEQGNEPSLARRQNGTRPKEYVGSFPDHEPSGPEQDRDPARQVKSAAELTVAFGRRPGGVKTVPYDADHLGRYLRLPAEKAGAAPLGVGDHRVDQRRTQKVIAPPVERRPLVAALGRMQAAQPCYYYGDAGHWPGQRAGDVGGVEEAL